VPVLQHCCAAFCFHRCMVCVMLLQSAACLICAVASGSMLRRWWRLDDYDRARIWKHYGLFCGLMCFGSCAGAVSYAALSFCFDGYYKSLTGGTYNYSFYSRVSFALRCSQLHPMARSQSHVTRFQCLRWFVVYLLAYPFTFCCLVTAKLLVLGRLTDFSKLKAHASSRWSTLGRALVGAIVVGNVAGLCCSIAGSVFQLKVADSYEQLASENITSAVFVNASGSNIDTDFENGFKFASAFFGFEAIILPLIVVAFVAVGAVSVRRIRAAMTAVQKAQLTSMLGATDIVGFGGARRASEASFVSGRRLKRQIVGTCGILFVSFSIRAAASMMLWIAAVFGNFEINSSTRCDKSLNNFTHMLVWILYTPEFFFVPTLLSQPVALLVTLWGMTSGQTIAVMRANSLDLK
jgi:hypothetical protein